MCFSYVRNTSLYVIYLVYVLVIIYQLYSAVLRKTLQLYWTEEKSILFYMFLVAVIHTPLICSDERINKTFTGGRIRRRGTCRENGQYYRHFDQCDWKRLPCATRCSIANVILMNTVLNPVPAYIITLQQLAELGNNFHNFYLTVDSSVAGAFCADSKCLTVCILLKMDGNNHLNNCVVNC